MKIFLVGMLVVVICLEIQGPFCDADGKPLPFGIMSRRRKEPVRPTPKETPLGMIDAVQEVARARDKAFSSQANVRMVRPGCYECDSPLADDLNTSQAAYKMAWWNWYCQQVEADPSSEPNCYEEYKRRTS